MEEEAKSKKVMGRRAGVASWRERVREEEQGCEFLFPLPLGAPVLCSISKAAGAPSSTTDKLEGKAEAFPFLFFPFLR